MSVVLRVNNVSKTFDGKITAVNNVSFSLESGEILGIIGPNGSGKTTLLSIITSLVFADKGNVEICGYDIKSKRKQALSLVATVPSEFEHYEYLSGYDNMRIFQGLYGKVSKEKII